MTFETSDPSDEQPWPDQQKDNDKDKYNDKYKDKDKESVKDIKRTPSIKEQSWRFVTWDLTLETLISLLTIENNNIDIYIVNVE